MNLGYSKKLENLEAACAIFLAYYNFRRPSCSSAESRTTYFVL